MVLSWAPQHVEVIVGNLNAALVARGVIKMGVEEALNLVRGRPNPVV